MGLIWKRSSRCSSNGCVEVAQEGGRALVRDSKNLGLEPLSFQRSEWMNTVLAPVMLGRLPSFVVVHDEWHVWSGHTVDGDPQVLRFTPEEWDAFGEGVKAGEFHPPPGSGPRGSNGSGPSVNNGMGPKPDKGQPFSDYRLTWGPRG